MYLKKSIEYRKFAKKEVEDLFNSQSLNVIAFTRCSLFEYLRHGMPFLVNFNHWVKNFSGAKISLRYLIKVEIENIDENPTMFLLEVKILRKKVLSITELESI